MAVRFRLFRTAGAWGLVLCLAAAAQAAESPWTIEPAAIDLSDPFAGRQLVVTSPIGDLTRAAGYESSNTQVATVDERGYVRPVGDGVAVIRITHGDGAAEAPVRVTGFAARRSIDFRSEIVPVLNRYGCNGGGCHGKASGQNGFHLSLFGFDSEFDFDAIVKQARGRRVFPAAPERSLLLLKATGEMPHGGGRRFAPEDEAYGLLRQWIEAGLPATSPEAPQVVSLSVYPRDAVLRRGRGQQLAVLAHLSNGEVRDATRQAEYASNLDVVATVDHEGYVASQEQSGEAAIMARYMGFVAVFRALAPHGEPQAEIAGFEPVNYIDHLAMEKWKKLGLSPSPPCDDATFLRRAMIDVCGRPPTVEETVAFLADEAADKRARLIDRLLDSPDYAAYFATRWGAILRNSRLAGADQAAYAFHNWLKDLIARNRPYDELVRGVVAAAGEWQDAPAINWYWQMRDDQLHQVTADTAQVFLGVRLACARCHHHPYERWSQEDYYGLAGFFTRLGRKSFGQPPPYFSAPNSTTGEKNPLTGRTPEPKFLDGEYARFTPEEDPRHALVDWMTQPDNPFFARVLVNRLWGQLFARGLVHEVDDLRESNPPSNPELLDALARDFVDHQFDMKHILRVMLTSRLYQLSSEPTPENIHDTQNYARYYARRLVAEVLLDAVDQATGAKTRFNGVAQSARAVDLPHEGFGSYFLDTFDRPARVTGCECERSAGATLAQVLLLANSDEIENKLAHGEGRLARLAKDDLSPEQCVDQLYLAALSRRPRSTEQAAAVAYLNSQENRQRALEDLLWTLLNAKEFLFNH